MIIYCATEINTGKRYIGRTIKPLPERIRRHKYTAENRIPRCKFHEALAANNFDFRWDIIETCTTTKTLVERETYWIRHYNTLDDNYGYNTAPAVAMTDATREKISQAKKGKKHSCAAKKKMSLAHIGLKHSPETIAKIRKATKGQMKRGFSPETIQKIKASKIGKRIPTEIRAKISRSVMLYHQNKKAGMTMHFGGSSSP